MPFGDEGLNWYNNTGIDAWSFNIEEFKLNGTKIKPESEKREALIDSASANIQIPRREFLKMKEIFFAVDPTVEEYTDPGTEDPILISKGKCVDLFKIYGDVHFHTHNTMLVLKPRGYLYNTLTQDGCIIGF